MNSNDYYNRDKTFSSKAVFIGMIGIILTILFLSCFNAQAQNLQADQMRIRYQNQNSTWTAWDTSECNVPITFSREMNIVQIHNKLDMTYSIVKGINSKWYESTDYEGRKLVIVLFKNPDSTFNVMVQYINVYDANGLLYPGYSYQYLHCYIVK